MRNCKSILIFDKELEYKIDLMLLRHINVLKAYIIIARVDVANGGKT